jgi:hypothetical protein
MLAKCPSCRKSQAFKILIKLKAGDEGSCKFCNGHYKLEFWKHSISMMVILLPPFLLGGVFNFYTGLLWLVLGFFGYFVFMPLKSIVRTQASEHEEKS